MRVLIANKFYYRRGGDCVCAIELEKLLKAKGHQVAFFSMQHPDNLPSVYSKYFPSEVSFTPGFGMVEAFMRPLGTKEVAEKFSALIDDFNPDVVHLNNIHTQLSPIIARIAHEKGIKVVWTIHDYKLLCPRYDCLRNGKTICELCFKDKFNVIRHCCMKNSFIASLLAYLEARKWNKEKLSLYSDAFICPSEFMGEKMIQGGFNKEQIHVVCNFVNTESCVRNYKEKADYYCYIGRLSHEKGINTLISAAERLSYKLKIIGGGPMMEDLKDKIKDTNIELVGYKSWDEIKKIVGKARFTVVPSEWYENNPMSVIESKCLGTPVLGASIGGIPELIETDISGMLFESRNISDLEQKIRAMWNTVFDYEKIAVSSQVKYNAEQYYNKIIKIYQ